MTAYQAGIANFEGMETQVLGISTDNRPTLQHWATEHLKTTFPLLSDFKHDVSKKYGVLDEQDGYARRTTFVVDANGIVQHVDQSREALDPSGAIGACSLVRKK